MTRRSSERASAMMAVTTRRALRRDAQVVHEAAVDLQLADRQGRQIGQRRIAGAEVVDRDLDVDLVQRCSAGMTFCKSFISPVSVISSWITRCGMP